jgi:hypothetical protein
MSFALNGAENRWADGWDLFKNYKNLSWLHKVVILVCYLVVVAASNYPWEQRKSTKRD